MKKASFLIIFFLLAPYGFTQSYSYMDESGNIHFTDSVSEIPTRYRKQIPGLVTPTPFPSRGAQKKGKSSKSSSSKNKSSKKPSSSPKPKKVKQPKQKKGQRGDNGQHYGNAPYLPQVTRAVPTVMPTIASIEDIKKMVDTDIAGK